VWLRRFDRGMTRLILLPDTLRLQTKLRLLKAKSGAGGVAETSLQVNSKLQQRQDQMENLSHVR
jgi:hypothetical protein